MILQTISHYVLDEAMHGEEDGMARAVLTPAEVSYLKLHGYKVEKLRDSFEGCIYAEITKLSHA